MNKIDHLLGPNGFIERKDPSTIVLLVHGLTGTPAEMKHLGRVISRKGISVACPELAGHCASIEALKATRWQDWYMSVERAFLALKEEYEYVFVSGLSMGALMSLILGAKHTNKVAGIIPLSSTFQYDGWNVWPFGQKVILPIVLHTPLKYFLHWEEKSPYGIKCERTRALVHSILENKDARTADKIGYFKTPAPVILESFGLIKATKAILKDVYCPTLIVHSTEDDMASLETNAHLVEKNISSPHIETMYIDDTYHVVTLDKRKDDIGKRIAEFCIHVVHLKKERS